MNLQDIFTKIVSKCALKKKFDKAIGVYANDDNIFCVNLNLVRTSEEHIYKWKVIDIAELKIFTTSEELSNFESESNKQDLIANKVSLLIKSKEWHTTSMALCLNVEDVVTDFEDLSNVPKNKIAASVNYQIAVAGDFEVDTYLSSFMEFDSGVWMEGISKIDASKWIQAFQKNGLELLALTTMPNSLKKIDDIDITIVDEDFFNRGGLKASFAGRSLAYQTNPNFFLEQTKELNGWNFARINAAIIFVTIFIIGGIFLFDFRAYNQAEEKLENARNQLALLESDQRKEAIIEKNSAALRNKNQIMTDLRKISFPWRSFLIHFGSIKVQGVWLREIRSSENGNIEIKGEAVSYEAMASYVKTLENNENIFSKVELKNSTMNSTGQLIQFNIALTL